MHGPTWWVLTLPYVEQDTVYSSSQFDNTTWFFNQTTNPNRPVYAGAGFPYMACPSSSLPQRTQHSSVAGDWFQDPMYTAITGSDQHVSRYPKSQTGGQDTLSSGGMLIKVSNLSESIRLNEVLDGTSNVVMVGEQSDYAYQNGTPRDVRTSNSRGFHMGTSYVARASGPASLDACKPPPGQGAQTNCQRCYNTTTIRWPINNGRKVFHSATMMELRCNKPIISAHPGGAHLLFGDAHVAFARQDMPVTTLKFLCDRDDGNPVSLP
jgi:prepilin-type processing-associated H-X9-DG protein